MTDLSIRLFVAMSSVMASIKDSMHREEGQDLIEYAVLAGAIGVVAAGAFFAAGFDFSKFTDTISGCIKFDATTCKP